MYAHCSRETHGTPQLVGYLCVGSLDVSGFDGAATCVFSGTAGPCVCVCVCVGLNVFYVAAGFICHFRDCTQ